MFDLDSIEQDWKDNSFCLSEEEIIEIYRSEGATLIKYEEELDKYSRKINSCLPNLSAEERILRSIFGEDLKEKEQRNKLIAETPIPQKKHLSNESQKRIVEGCLYMVFDETRSWYNFFEGKLSMERIYYICLEALMNSVKYMVHCEKPVFSSYVSKNIERNMIKHIARYTHIAYREAYEMVHYVESKQLDINLKLFFDSETERLDKKLELLFDSERKEEPEKPSKIHYQLKNDYYDMNYIKNISSDEFMIDYSIALEELDGISKIVMQLSFDENGYRGLTNREIADYLGVGERQISNIRRRAIKILRKDIKLNSYLI